MCREQDQAVQPETRAVYTPLIDMVPSHPDTIMTAMVESQRLTNSCGQAVTIFTNDQQLYKVAVNVMWVHPEQFVNFIPRLGGMHMLMSYIGAVGTLRSNTGLEELMQSTFGGVPKMLTGKKFPQNARALRMVVEVVLKEIIQNTDTHNDLMAVLEERASRSRTTKMWLDNLIKPVMIMMTFIQAEREGDWQLHLWSATAMMPYFFASGHYNYARYLYGSILLIITKTLS